MASSIKSTALEPTRHELANASLPERLKRYAAVYGLVILAVALALLFSVLLPETFPTMINLRSIIGDKAIIAILSLAVMLPMVTGKIDLTVGYGIVLWHILAISLQTKYGFPWPIAVLTVLALGAGVGFLNGVLVEVAQIDDLPITGYYVLALALVLWIVLEYLPIGRYFYTIGANPKAAALNGIAVRRYTVIAFVTSGTLAAFAGVLLASRLRIGQASVGLEYLLPALVGAFLGSTTIKPGRVNVWGTIVGVAILAIGISGIQQFGASFFVEPLFNGSTLLVAIGIAGYAQRRRGAGSSRAPASPAQTNGSANDPKTASKGV